MLRKALTHQGASLQTLSLGWGMLLAKTRESLRRTVPKNIPCHPVNCCLEARDFPYGFGNDLHSKIYLAKLLYLSGHYQDILTWKSYLLEI